MISESTLNQYLGVITRQVYMVSGDHYVLLTLCWFNPLTTGPDYVFKFFISTLNTNFKHSQDNKNKNIKQDNNRLDFKIVDLHFVKSE